ncbi:hypothetical protein C5688_05475 [Methylocystis sp. MitZ-2018]|nr:hypothetical protein C5688_05475 [Methylocystis sp. MitZ-2018]
MSSATSRAGSKATSRCAIFARPLYLAERVREQRQKQRGKKDHSLRTLEVECIGKGKMQCPNEFGVKVSAATTLHLSKGAPVAGPVKRCQATPSTLARRRRLQLPPPAFWTQFCAPACSPNSSARHKK